MVAAVAEPSDATIARSPEEVNRLVGENLRLAYWVARRFEKLGHIYEDCVQEGIFGLIQAAERYDATRGKFASLAVPYVYGHILRFLHNDGRIVRRPVNRWERGPVPRDRSLNVVRGGVNGVHKEEWLEQLVDENADQERDVADLHDDALVRPMVRYALRMVLTDKQRAVIIGRHLLETPKMLEEIGQELGVTRERIRQIQVDAEEKLRRHFRKVMPERFGATLEPRRASVE